MSMQRRYDVRQDEKPKTQVHPIWRGIGCLLIVLLPIISYAGSVLIVDANELHQWIMIPHELTGPSQYPFLYAYLVSTGLLVILGFTVIFSVYALFYRIIGPPRHGPLDAPPPKKVRRRKR